MVRSLSELFYAAENAVYLDPADNALLFIMPRIAFCFSPGEDNQILGAYTKFGTFELLGKSPISATGRGVAVDENYIYVAATISPFTSIGVLRWHKKTGNLTILFGVYGNGFRSVAVDSSGYLYLGGMRQYIGEDPASVWKLTPNGTLIWAHNTGDDVNVVAVDNSGIVYAGRSSVTKHISKIDSDGTLIWDKRTLWQWGSVYGIVVDGSGNIYIAQTRGTSTFTGDQANVIKLDSDGDFVWEYDTGGSMTSSVTIHPSGQILVAGTRYDSNSIWLLDSDGVLQGAGDTGGTTRCVVADSDGNIYIAGNPVGVEKINIWAWTLEESLWEKSFNYGPVSQIGYGAACG